MKKNLKESFAFRILLLLCIFLCLIGLIARNPVLVFSENDEKLAVSSGLLRQHVETLVDFPEPRNFQNLHILNQSAAYIASQFKPYCDEVLEQIFIADGSKFKNIRCKFKGESPKIIVMGAHYDVAGEQDGADDNASGVSGLLELARLISESQVKLKHDLELVAYTLEEPPYFRTVNMGSYHHAQLLRKSNIEVEFMLSIEMIGYFVDDWFSQSYPSPLLYLFYPLRGNFMAIVGGVNEFWSIRKLKKLFAQGTDLPIYSLNAPSVVPGIDFSDHLNYWDLGMEAYMISDTSFYRNKNYHKTTDSISTLDFDRMGKVVSGIFNLIQHY
ncbi:M28 family peptidase [Bacteriovoracaceae bacterium]|nr:M28 family peptidase [Bacteriovoracaceae bacterium]